MSKALRQAMFLGLAAAALGFGDGHALASPSTDAAAVEARIDAKLHAMLAKLLKRTAQPTVVAAR